MINFLKISGSFHPHCIIRLQPTVQFALPFRFCHSQSNPGFDSSYSSLVRKGPQDIVGIFWDLDNKPPNSVCPYEAATRLKKTVSSFGVVRYMVAYANQHTFSYVPTAVWQKRQEGKWLNHLENEGIIKPMEPHVCRVCGRKFHTSDRLKHHFEIHEREHHKRLIQIESAKGKKRVNLVAKYSMKMEKYKIAAKDILIPKVGYGLADELKRAGFWVETVSDKPQAADVALRNHMLDMMDHRRAQCLVLVSDDNHFVDVLKEAKERCLKTVVVGDHNDGILKRTADACFSWRDILKGKAKKEAVSVLGRWKDSDILKRLEWSYDAENDKDASDSECKTDGVVEEEFEDVCSMEDEKPMFNSDNNSWWKLDSDDDMASSKPST